MARKNLGEPPEPAQQNGERKERATYDVSPEQFVHAWQTSDSADEVAEKLKMPKPIVHARVSLYRQFGIKLKKMPRRRKDRLDVEALNRMIERIDRQQGR